MLAGLPNAPSVYSPDKNPELAEQRMRQVVNRMLACGVISSREAEPAAGRLNTEDGACPAVEKAPSCIAGRSRFSVLNRSPDCRPCKTRISLLTYLWEAFILLYAGISGGVCHRDQLRLYLFSVLFPEFLYRKPNGLQ